MRNLDMGKWRKHTLMCGNKKLETYVPDAIEFSKRNLWNFIDRYSEVIVKPTYGSRGRNIYKLSSLGKGKYEIHYKNQKQPFIDRDTAFAYLEQKIGSRSFIIQQYIPLAKIEQSLFDIRVMTQRVNLTSPWAVTGKVAKVAGSGFIVTNNRMSNGSVLPVEKAIRGAHPSISSEKNTSLLKDIDRIALLATESLTRYYKEQRVYGFDMAIDTQGDIWIIEVNLRPLISHFRKLQDQSMYRTIRYKYKYER
ncbi:YheC/YheD family protein [Sporosarcina jiandibaonis]|uniref:YheC/YheD family protein n=1 Tax=Sporosarcina jiandibaonis TaxID=2715535 RepID=UPI001555CEA9|nr:YheC/YheD family protein [Sporosarcina jiandibaonis]